MLLLSDLHRAGLVDQVQVQTAEGLRLVSACGAVGHNGEFDYVPRGMRGARGCPDFTLVAEDRINDARLCAAIQALVLVRGAACGAVRVLGAGGLGRHDT